MNVLVVHPCRGFYGGAEEVVVQLCRYLLNGGHDVSLITKNPPEGWGIYSYALHARSWWEFRQMVQYHLPWADAICCFNFPATLATFPTEKPIVWYCNEPPELFTNWWRKPVEAFNRWWVKKSRMKVVVADEFNKERFRGIYGVTPKVVPYGVDYEFWSGGKIGREAFTLFPKESLRLLQVGTISEYKNQRASIKLLDWLRNEKGVNATLTLVGGIGDKVYGEHLVEDIVYRGLVPYVQGLGQRTQEEVRLYYNTHDILLHTVKGQGGWLVPFEACCTGIKVIVSKQFSAADFFGCWMEDVESVLEYTKEGRDNVSMYQPSREWVKENLGWEKFGGGMLSIFEEVLKK